MRLRFAPSPTGQLHVGNARTALFNWLLARRHQGTFILRIEDTDTARSTADAEESILQDLRWLGLQWQEGPDVGGDVGPYRQSERLDLYRTFAHRLLERGGAYYCFCTEDMLEADRALAVAAGTPAKYRGTCRRLSPQTARARLDSGEAAAVRFAVPSELDEIAFHDLVRGEVAFKAEVVGDFVILRSDGHPAYNFAVVVDDAVMKITHVVRGEDHISNTPRQLLIYRSLDFEPPQFAHLAMVLGPDHTRLSKRHGATSVAEFRAKGFLPEALANYLALIGWSPGGGDELLALDELVRRFDLKDVGHSAGVFDADKLAWVNRHYLRRLSREALVALALPYLQRAGFVTTATASAHPFLEGLLGLAQEAVDRLDQVPARVAFVFDFDVHRSLASPDERAILEQPGAKGVIVTLADELSRAGRLGRESFRAVARRVRERTGLKGSALFHPIRVAMTGLATGPELDLAIPVIEHGAELSPASGVAPVIGCRERSAAFATALRE